MILGAGIERLGDDDRADDDAEQGAREKRGPGTRAEQPEGAAAAAELGGRQNLDLGEVRQQLLANGVDVLIGSHPNEQVRDLVRWYPDIALRLAERREDVGRCRERPDALGDRRHLYFLVANFGGVAVARDPEPREISAVDRDRMGGCERAGIAR